MAEYPATHGLDVDIHDKRFQRGKDDAFKAWWAEQTYHPETTDKVYLQGYDFGWEMASDPLHEDSYDPQLDSRLQGDHD